MITLRDTTLLTDRKFVLSGDEGDRTPDPNTASVVLSQLSYVPRLKAVLSAWFLAVTGSPGNSSEIIT